MKTITTTAIVALMTATIGLSAIAPAFAQDAGPAPSQQGGPGFNFRHDNQDGPRGFGRMGGGDLLSFDRGVEAVEIALVRLSYRIELTAEQQPLFDAFKTAALSAAETLSTATEGLRPPAPVEGETATAPDFSERLQNRIAIETARLAALEAVQPSATAFFDSLTEEQLNQLQPQRPGRHGMPGFGKFGGPRHQGEAAPEAPAEAPPANG